MTEFVTPRRIVVAVASAVGIWLTASVGLAGLYRVYAPASALFFSGKDSRAKESLADAILRRDGPALGMARAASLAKEALVRDPTSAVALRILGFAAPEANQSVIFDMAARLSRRDLQTQLWLIEQAVSGDNVSAALVHHDIALRTSTVAQPLLFPVLSEATGERTLVPEITRMLARKPDWAMPFLFEAVNSAPSSANLVAIFAGLKAGGAKIDPALAQNLISRTVRDNRFDLTLKAYQIAGGKNGNAGLSVADGSFSGAQGVEPFSWSYNSEAGLYADRTAVSGNDGRVVIRAEAGVSGTAIKQLLLLKPGSYQLTATAGDLSAEDRAKYQWTVSCAKTEAVIGSFEIKPNGAKSARSLDSFTVPATECPAQWLALNVNAEMDSDGTEPWIDDVTITRQGSARSAASTQKTEAKQ